MEKIDLLYILGKGSRWHDNELRFSIRSAVKFFNFNKIFIVGELPKWLTGVVHVPVPDNNKNKLLNARDKYLASTNIKELSDNFILMNDDFFFLKQTDEIPNYTRGKMSDQILQHQTMAGYYFKSLCDTKNRLIGMGVDEPIDFEVHAPIIFNKEKLKTVIAMVGTEKPYLLRSCYGNLINLEPTEVLDYKAGNVVNFLAQLKRDENFLSIADGLIVDDDFRNWIIGKYPKPTKYENDGGAGIKALPGRPMKCLNYTATKQFEYQSKLYHQGDIIPSVDMEKIKSIPKLRANWELK